MSGQKAHDLAPLGAKTRFPWPVCQRCGLVALKNEATRRALRQPCGANEPAAPEKK